MEEHKAEEVEFVKVKSSVAFGRNKYIHIYIYIEREREIDR